MTGDELARWAARRRLWIGRLVMIEAGSLAGATGRVHADTPLGTIIVRLPSGARLAYARDELRLIGSDR